MNTLGKSMMAATAATLMGLQPARAADPIPGHPGCEECRAGPWRFRAGVAL